MEAPARPTNFSDGEAIARVAGLFGLPRMEPGWVWLAGAGPGDPGLASLLTLIAIADADVIFTDALIERAILKLARADAQIVDAGKRGGRPSPKQTFITRSLIAQARHGKRVLRLKGGDPFVFGRGAEEALALTKARIPFRIVPGISAGIGGLAYAGIPVTHRETNHAVTFVTGHDAKGNIPDLDWAAIGKGSPTIVLYMARAHAGTIADKLIAAGRGPNEPAAVIANATLAAQSRRITTLANLGAAAAETDAPAILVIGENVRLSATLDWLSPRLLTAA